MFFYLTIFFLVIFFSCIAERARKSDKLLSLSLVGLCILILSIVSGCRDVKVGADTWHYPIYVYQGVGRSHSAFEAIEAVTSSIEPGYKIVAYFCRVICGGSFNFFLFFTHLIMYSTFYIGAYRMRRLPLWAFSFLFLFIFYNQSMAMNRQFMALGITFWSVTFLIEKRLVIFCLLAILAFFFHRSSAFSLLLIPLLYLNNRYNIYVILFCIAIVIFYTFFMEYITEIDVLMRYQAYADDTFEGFFSISEFIMRFTFICLLLFVNKKDALYYNVITLFICEFIINMLQLQSKFAGRIGLSMFIMNLYYLPYYLLYDNKRKILSVSIVLTLCMCYWWYVYILNNAGETAHYTSSVLGIL